MWFRAAAEKEQFWVVVLKHYMWPVNKPRFTCAFVQWLIKEQFCVVFFKRPLLAS